MTYEMVAEIRDAIDALTRELESTRAALLLTIPEVCTPDRYGALYKTATRGIV